MGSSNDNNVGKKKDIHFFDALNRLIVGIQTVYPATHTFQVDGRTVAQPDYVTKLQAEYGLQAKVNEGRTSLNQAIAARTAGIAGAKRAYEAAVAAIKADKGPDSPDLLAFGIEPKKARTPMTSAQRVIAASKRTATRKARGILGKRQREAITVTGRPGVVVVSADGASTETVQPRTAPVAAGHPPGSTLGNPAQGTGPAPNPPSSNGSATGSGNSGH